jgi:arylsulfatase A-like enzyme
MKNLTSLAILLIFLTSCGPTPAATDTPLPAPSPTAASSIPAGKPNIILVLADDLDASAIQYMPKLQSLVTDQGETFTNYMVSESLCCPSRATTLRGQYPHNTGIVANLYPLGGYRKWLELDEEKSTVGVWLHDAGYHTMMAGKYFNGYPLKTDPLRIPAGWDEWYVPVEGVPYDQYDYTLNENGQEVAYAHEPEDYGTDVYVGKAVDFIKRNATEGSPVFVYLAPFSPHSPYTPAPRHADLFADLKAPRTPNYNEEDVSDKPGYIRNRSLLTQAEQDSIDEDYRNRARALQAIDEGIEAIVNALEANGQLDNTYIFFVADNGYHLGNHRQSTGKVSPYEEEMRVTMRVRGPGVPAGVVLDHLVGNVDLAPTWVELAGAQAPDFLDGRSLVPLMRAGPPALDQWRQEYLLEYGVDEADEPAGSPLPTPDTEPGLLEPEDGDERAAAAASPEERARVRPPSFRGMRLQNLSYVEYRTGEIELYDLISDPYQLQNLASSADPQLLADLAARLNELSTCQAEACRTAESAPFDLLRNITP